MNGGSNSEAVRGHADGLKLRLIVGAIVIFSSLSASQWLRAQALESTEDHARVVNVAGRQRMLCERLSRLAVMQMQGTTTRAAVRETLTVWNAAHSDLTDGALGKAFTSDAITRAYENLEADRAQFLATLDAVGLPGASPGTVTRLDEARARVLAHLDGIVGLYESESNRALSDLETQSRWLFVGALLALAAVCLFVVLPVVRRVDQTWGELDRANRRYEEQRDEAVALADSRKRFLRTVSHELRTPLGGLIGALELARDTDDESSRSELLRLGHDSSLSLKRLVDDLLDYERINAGRLALHYEAVELRSLIQEVLRLFQAAADEKGVQLRLDADRILWTQQDPLRLAQILRNLVSNAVKFTPSGWHVTVRLVPAAGDDTRICIWVEDTGPGIPDAALDRIFVPFAQADDSVQRSYGGSGLGLGISRALADAMGGAINVESVLGQGSRFSVELPARPAIAPVRPELSETHLPPRLAEAGPALRVLVVDDDPVNRQLTANQLARLGYDTESAENGRLALAALNDAPFDIVVLDGWMPELDGLEAARRIRAGDTLDPSVPIVGLTAHADEQDLEAFRQAGANLVLTKPVCRKQLRVALASLRTGGDAS